MGRAQATPQELEEALTKYALMNPRKRYEWFAERLAKRAVVGLSCTVTAFKPRS